MPAWRSGDLGPGSVTPVRHREGLASNRRLTQRPWPDTLSWRSMIRRCAGQRLAAESAVLFAAREETIPPFQMRSERRHRPQGDSRAVPKVPSRGGAYLCASEDWARLPLKGDGCRAPGRCTFFGTAGLIPAWGRSVHVKWRASKVKSAAGKSLPPSCTHWSLEESLGVTSYRSAEVAA